MSEANEQNSVGEAQPPVEAQQPDLGAQLELVKAKNAELISERRKDRSLVEDMQRQIAELQNANTKQKQAKLQENGQFETLWKEASESNATLKQTIADLEKRIEEKEAAYVEQTVKASAVSAFQQAGVQQPDHMYALLRDKLRLSDGEIKAIHGGVEQPLTDFVQSLKAPDSPYAYQFNGSGARGMSSAGSTPTQIGGMENPYLPGGSVFKRMELEMDQPDLAARLKAQAQAA